MTKLRMTILIAVACLTMIAAVPAMADTEIPEEWLGIWEVYTEIYDCETEELEFTSTHLDTICPGSVFEDPDPDSGTIECTSSADSDSYTIHCEGSEEVVPGCTANFIYDATSTRTGDSYASVGTTTITYTGDCPLIPDFCQRTEITGTRIAGVPNPCDGAPVEGYSWSSVKSIYR